MANSQSSSPFMGARAYGIGNASICLNDEWSIFNNIAALASTKESIAAVSCLARKGLEGSNTIAALIALPTKYGSVGIGVLKFGDNLYSESRACLGFSHTLGITSIGVRVDYNQYSAEGFGTKGVASVSFGALTQLTPKFSIAALIVNINQPSISANEDQKLPSILVAGVGFKASESVFITGQAEKKIDESLIVRAGLEYRFHKKFFIRTGFSSNPDAGYAGIGLKTTRLIFNYAYRYDFNLGSSHQAGAAFQLKKK